MLFLSELFCNPVPKKEEEDLFTERITQWLTNHSLFLLVSTVVRRSFPNWDLAWTVGHPNSTKPIGTDVNRIFNRGFRFQFWKTGLFCSGRFHLIHRKPNWTIIVTELQDNYVNTHSICIRILSIYNDV